MRPLMPFALFALAACEPSVVMRGSDAGATPDAAEHDAGARAIDAGSRDAGGWTDTGLRPAGRFAEIWSDLQGADGPLGYPVSPELTGASCAWQPFEGGTMLWVERRTFLEGCLEFCEFPRIFSIAGGTGSATMGAVYYRDPDDWVEGTDPFTCAEANRTEVPIMGYPKPLGPVRGFGKVWCENEAVQTGMGAALQPELGGAGFLPCDSQLFQGGLVVHNPNESLYWVLLEDRTWRRYDE